jgi:hypothetical protein
MPATISHTNFAALEAHIAARRAVTTGHDNVRAHTSAALVVLAYDALCHRASADRLVHLLVDDDTLSVRAALTQLGYTVESAPGDEPEPVCYVAVDGETGYTVRVFADSDAAHEFSGGTAAGAGTLILDIPFEAAIPDLPEGFDLDMLAYDIADVMDKGEYGLGDLSQDDFRAVLPAFLAAAQTHAAAHPEA